MTYQTICILGDSIANGMWDEQGKGGWAGRLQTMLMQEHPCRYAFCNLAVAGYTSEDVLKSAQSELLSRNPTHLIISVGSNDCLHVGSAQAPSYVSPSKQTETWSTLLPLAKDLVGEVLVLGVLPVLEERYPPSYGPYYKNNAELLAYDQALENACLQHQCSYLRLRDLFDKVTIRATGMMMDQAHPAAAGHARIADAVYRQIKTLQWA